MPPPSRWTLLSVTYRYALCGGALYWTSKQGFWSGFCQSQELYDSTDKVVKQSIRKVEKKYGIRILRDEDTVKRELRYYSYTYWNKGIQNVFFFTANAGKILQGYYSNYTLGNLMTKNKEEIESSDLDDDDLDEKGLPKLPAEGKIPAEKYIPETKSGGDQRSAEANDVSTKPPDSKGSSDVRERDVKSVDIKGGGVQPAAVTQVQPAPVAQTQRGDIPPTQNIVRSSSTNNVSEPSLSDLKPGDKVLVKGHEVDPKTADKTDKVVDKIKKLHGM